MSVGWNATRETKKAGTRIGMGFSPFCCHSLGVSPRLLITANNPLSSAAILMLMITRPLGHHKVWIMRRQKEHGCLQEKTEGEKEAYLSTLWGETKPLLGSKFVILIFSLTLAMKDRVPPLPGALNPHPDPSPHVLPKKVTPPHPVIKVKKQMWVNTT